MTIMPPSPKFILLSAGNSERMGTDKGLLNFHGIPWIIKQTKEAQVHCEELIVVANSQNISLYKTLLRHPKISFVLNPKAKSEIFDSIVLALKSTDFPVGAFLSPIDVPVSNSLVKKIKEIATTGMAAVPVYHQKKGHPVFLSHGLITRILSNEFSERRLDHILHHIEKDVVHIQTNEQSSILNFNTPEDWERIK